jgi:large subunit ribosomal protein L21
MYAIIRTGGKQYKVQPGDVLRVEKLDGELGAEMDITDVLMIGGDKTFVGSPTVAGKVRVVVTNQQRGPKLIIFKKKRRQGYRRMNGHRQNYTELFIMAITNPEGTTAKADSKAQVFDPKKKAEAVEKTRTLAREAKLARRSEGADAPAKAAAPKAKKKVAKKSAGGKKKVAKKKVGKKAAKKTSKK